MGNLNKVQLIGRLGQEPEKRVTNNGNSVVSVSLATTEYYNDSTGNKQERTEWHRLVFWGKLADIIAQFGNKGKQIYVEGSLRTKEWQDKEGVKRYTTEINVNNLQLLDSAGQNKNQQGDYQRPYDSGSSNMGNSSFQRKNEQPNYDYQPQNQGNKNMGQPAYDDNNFIEDDVPF